MFENEKEKKEPSLHSDRYNGSDQSLAGAGGPHDLTW